MKNNKITELFATKKSDIVNIYFTAGFPQLESTEKIIWALSLYNVDMIELGMPYSDPLADGLTIQQSSRIALENGINLDIIFDQVSQARKHTGIPIILMGYLNQMMQYGEERFLQQACEAGVDGLIIPDLPMHIYKDEYIQLFEKYGMKISFLVTPQTSDERIQMADKLSSAFLYVVSQSSITGKTGDISESQISYFQRLENMDLTNPRLIGFGIHDQHSLNQATKYANGVIIGSAFIRSLMQKGKLEDNISTFMNKIGR